MYAHFSHDFTLVMKNPAPTFNESKVGILLIFIKAPEHEYIFSKYSWNLMKNILLVIFRRVAWNFSKGPGTRIHFFKIFSKFKYFGIFWVCYTKNNFPITFTKYKKPTFCRQSKFKMSRFKSNQFDLKLKIF